MPPKAPKRTIMKVFTVKQNYENNFKVIIAIIDTVCAKIVQAPSSEPPTDKKIIEKIKDYITAGKSCDFKKYTNANLLNGIKKFLAINNQLLFNDEFKNHYYNEFGIFQY
jgi:hypothetical protein